MHHAYIHAYMRVIPARVGQVFRTERHVACDARSLGYRLGHFSAFLFLFSQELLRRKTGHARTYLVSRGRVAREGLVPFRDPLYRGAVLLGTKQGTLI